jgi:2-(3-amino-3-carboxypropyl)histidine synthase
MKKYDFEEERVKQEIQRLNAKRVLIQLPEGLKPEVLTIVKSVEKAGALPIVSADPCYGACDLATAEAESLGADLIIHYGHSKLLKYERVPTLYIEARATLNVNKAVNKALPMLENHKKIGLVTTIQHVQTLDGAKEILLQAGKTVEIGDAGRLDYAGQVVGCDYSNAKSVAKDVDAFLFVGGGKFHALGVVLSTAKPTIIVDPYENRAFVIDKEAERIIKQRWAIIEEARKAKTFGVLVGLKPGQKRLEAALNIKKRLEEKGNGACVLAAKEITPEVLMEFPTVDAFVNTACPRISLDGASKFKKPVLTINEVAVVIGELSWEELCKKGWLDD